MQRHDVGAGKNTVAAQLQESCRWVRGKLRDACAVQANLLLHFSVYSTTPALINRTLATSKYEVR